MSWPEFCAARQYLLEEQIGTNVRAASRREEAEASVTADAIRRNPTQMLGETAELAVKLSLKDGLTPGINKVQGNLRKLDSGLGRVGRGTGKLGSGLLRAGAIATGVAAGGLALVAHKAIEMDDAFAAVVKTVGDASTGELQELNNQLHDLATRIPVSYTDLAGIAAEAGALGVAKQDIVGFTETVARLSAATQGLSVDVAAEAFGKFKNSLQLTEAEIERSASALIALGNAGASSEGDIIEIGKRFAGAGRVAGLSAAQVLGLASAISSVGVAPEAAGGALSRLFNKVNLYIGTGDKKLKAFAKTTGQTVEGFTKGFKKDALGSFEAFLKGLSGLTGPQIAKRLNAAGITNSRDIAAVQLLAKSYGEVARQTDLATEAFDKNTDLADVSAKRFDTLKNNITVLKNNFIEAGYNIAQGFLPALGRAVKKMTEFLQLPETKKSLRELGEKLGATLDKIDFNKLLTTAQGAADALLPLVDALVVLAGAFNALPAQVKGVGVAALLANKASGGLIASGLGDIIGGLGSTLAKSLAASVPLFGRAFVQPVFVTNIGGLGGGIPGVGGVGGAAGGILAGAAIPVVLTVGSIAALAAALVFSFQHPPDVVKPGLRPSEGGDVIPIGRGFGPRSGHGQRTDTPSGSSGASFRAIGRFIAGKLDIKELGGKLDHNIDKLGHLQSQLHKSQESGNTQRTARLQARIDRTNQRVDAAKKGITSATVQARDAARHAGISTTNAEDRAANAIVAAIYAAVPNINLFVTASNVTSSITQHHRAGPTHGSSSAAPRRPGNGTGNGGGN